MSPNVIDNVIQYIDANINNNLTVNIICEHIQCSRKKLDRKFKSIRGETLSQYLRNKKAEMAVKEVASCQNTIEFIANEYNYCGASFSRLIKRLFGCRPKDIAYGKVQINLSNTEDDIVTERDLAEIITALDGLQAKGVFKYRFSINQKQVIISEVNYNWIYEFLRSRPNIPLPAELFMFLKKEHPDDIPLVIALAYFEMHLNNYDITKMRWRLEDLMDISNNPPKKFEKIFTEVECWYDLDNPSHDERNNLLWFHIQDKHLDKLAKVIKNTEVNDRPFENDSNESAKTIYSDKKANKNYGGRANPFDMEMRIHKAINKLPPLKREVAWYMIMNMDETGHCTLNRDELAKAIGCNPKDLDMDDIANTFKNLKV